jgi:threonine/homoserine/homoserine lactone efflux protein
MPDLTSLLLFLAAATLLAVTPGPGIFYVAARSLSGGRAVGVASSFGTGLGGLFHVLAGSLGVSALVLASAALFTALKLLGAAYLLWLGLRAWRAASQPLALGPVHQTDERASRAFYEGVWVEALNPKTATFFLAFLPQFITPANGSIVTQFLSLGLLSVCLNTAADLVVALAAGRLHQQAATAGSKIRRMRQGAAAGMMALGLGLLFAQRPST